MDLALIINIIQWAKVFAALVFVLYVAIIDFKHKLVPNKALIYALIARGVVLALEIIIYFISNKSEVPQYFMGDITAMLILFAFMFIVNLITKGGVGMGDVKLIGVLAVWVGFALAFYGLLLGLCVSAIYCGYKLVEKKIDRKDTVPFVPFLAIGFVLALVLWVIGII